MIKRNITARANAGAQRVRMRVFSTRNLSVSSVYVKSSSSIRAQTANLERRMALRPVANLHCRQYKRTQSV